MLYLSQQNIYNMAKLILVLLSITQNKALQTETTGDVFRKHNKKILDEIMASDDPFDYVHVVDAGADVFDQPIIKK